MFANMPALFDKFISVDQQHIALIRSIVAFIKRDLRETGTKWCEKKKNYGMKCELIENNMKLDRR